MKLITLNLPEEWIKRIDETRGDVSRAAWIREAIRDALIAEKAWTTPK